MDEIKYESSLNRSVRYTRISPLPLRIPIIRLQGHLFHEASSVNSILIFKTNHYPLQNMLITLSV